jgi:hypothetical protein
MRATQFVRRGLIAFAAVATLSAGFAGAASAQAFIDGDDAIVLGAVPGYDVQVVHTASGERTALLGVSTGAGNHPVAVRFIPDFDGAAIFNVITPDVIAERPGE